MPFIFVLMSNRIEITYRAIFGYIHENILCLECKSMMSDYERAMRNAFAAVVPSAKQYGCLFHYTQALRRFAQKHPGLVRLLITNPAANKIYKKLMCLVLLPAESIVAEFDIIEKEAQELDSKFNVFTSYIKRQWLTRVFICDISLADLDPIGTVVFESLSLFQL